MMRTMTSSDISNRGGQRATVATWVRAAVVMACVILRPVVAHAQSEVAGDPLKPGAARTRPVCAVARSVFVPNPEQRQRARNLLQQGQQAAMLGDSPAELRALRDASDLDPSDPDLAYQLARAYEAAKDSRNAVAEYCRFLSLAPTARDAGDVVEKIRTLAPPRPDQIIDLTLAIFRSGVTAYHRGQFAAADSAFTQSIDTDGEWADAYYNRARVRTARGDRTGARSDFAVYLALDPEAGDRRQVERQMAALGPQVLSPLQALAFGVVIPGGGQFYADRPIRGVLTIAGVAAATGVAVLKRNERPYLIGGIVTASGIAAVSALNAALHVQSSQDGAGRVGLSFVPGANLLVARVNLPSPW